ncbi:hypothetical protein NEUTE2DRAFT_56089, partial [Neurospora tetrasperma FGSC 2509]
YKVRDKILFNTENLNTGRPYAKFTPLFEGPFKILKVDNYLVTLKRLINIKYNPLFYINKIKLWDKEGLLRQTAVEE